MQTKGSIVEIGENKEIAMLELGLSQLLPTAGHNAKSRVVKAVFIPSRMDWEQRDGDRIRAEAALLPHQLPVVLQDETGPCHNHWITRRRIDNVADLIRFLAELEGDDPDNLREVCQRLCPVSAVAEQDRYPAAMV